MKVLILAGRKGSRLNENDSKLNDADIMDVMFYGQLFTKYDVETIATANKWKLTYVDDINGVRR